VSETFSSAIKRLTQQRRPEHQVEESDLSIEVGTTVSGVDPESRVLTIPAISASNGERNKARKGR